ncbi:MAG: LexA family protein [Planctomycetota bacterium]
MNYNDPGDHVDPAEQVDPTERNDATNDEVANDETANAEIANDKAAQRLSEQSWLPFPLTPPGVRAPLTSVQKQVLDFIYEYRSQFGVSPTLQEIGNKLETHRVTVHAHVNALLKKKYLVRYSDRASRSLIPFDELVAMAARDSANRDRANRDSANNRGQSSSTSKTKTNAGRTRVRGTSEDANSNSSSSQNTNDSPAAPSRNTKNVWGESLESNSGDDSNNSLMLPLVGKIAAGKPLETVYDNEMLDVAALFPKERDLFVLEVTGESMIDEQIRSGDYVICEKRSSAQNGEIVVAVLPSEFGGQGEATLKRFFREREKNRIRLQPANKAMTPIFIEPPRQVEIRGVVCGVIRRYK